MTLYHGSLDKIPTITQENLYLLLPSKVAWVADMLVEDTGMTVEDAVCRIYDSEMYRQLEQEHTKLWHEGPVALYQQLLCPSC